jgi:hypothetical protein
MYIVVERNGTLKEIANVDVLEYGKRKGVWKLNGKTIYLYGRTKQKHSSKIVKYDFPPPYDEKIFYGKCLLVNPIEPLTISEWETIYEELMGGFEDIESESELSADETNTGTVMALTKEGYVKDGFVVSDDEV